MATQRQAGNEAWLMLPNYHPSQRLSVKQALRRKYFTALPLTTYYLLLTTLSTYHLLLSTCCSLLATHYLLLTTYYQALGHEWLLSPLISPPDHGPSLPTAPLAATPPLLRALLASG
eukprot:scaffold130005_cov30-Phaeocystis_antarctica.AAC.1